MNMQEAIRTVAEGRSLERGEMVEVMRTIMGGDATPAQIGGFLVGLRMKGESVDEIAAAAEVMRGFATRVEIASTEHLVDIVGTGGDGSGSFNISTASAFVVAAAGARVAKHGNRSASSTSGSADLLEAAGVALDLGPAGVARCVDEIGIGFMFAPHHHPAMRHAIGPRREMAVRTVFNLLGPLTNPAGAPNQLMGVFAAEWVEPLAQVLRQLGSEHVLVVHSDDGLDEIGLGGATRVAELRDGEVASYAIDPAEFGFERAAPERFAVDSPAASLATVRAVFDDRPGPARDVVALNAGAGIYAAGVASGIAEGVERAREAIASGAARERLDALVELTRSLAAAAP